MKKLIHKQKQIFFFILAGGLSAIIEIGSFKIFSSILPLYYPSETNLWGIHYPFSNILSTSCGIISNYFFSIWFVFERGKHSKKREFAYFMGLSVASTIFSLLFFQLFFSFVFQENLKTPVFTFSPEIMSKIAAIVVVSILNYSLKKRVIFNN
jgi:putative flippase GtrA